MQESMKTPDSHSKLKLKPQERRILRVLAIISSLYVGLVFIGVIPVHCDAYHPPAPTPAQVEAARQAELYAASSKAVEQIYCNVWLILTGTTGKAMFLLVVFFFFLTRYIVSARKKLRKHTRRSH